MKQTKVSEAVRGVLRDSTLGGQSLTLPPRDLGRKLYGEVKAFLDKLDGKWSTQGSCFLFSVDAMERLHQAIEAGYTVHRRNTYQEFFTPANIAEAMAELAYQHWEGNDIPGNTFRVLEPSAGTGALVRAIEAAHTRKEGLSICACDVQQSSLAQIEASVTLRTVCCDFLASIPPAPSGTNGYHAILMNPPFDKKTWAKHVEHAIRFMVKSGCLVSVVPRNASLRDLGLETVADAYITPVVSRFDNTRVEVAVLTIGISKEHVDACLKPIRAKLVKFQEEAAEPLKHPDFYLKQVMRLNREANKTLRELERELRKCVSR